MTTERRVVIVGLGYVGLPLAVLAREKGWSVVGLDNQPAVADRINNRQVPFTDASLARQLAAHPITATVDPACARDASVIVIAVPTPVTATNKPDLSPLRSALHNLLPHLSGGQTLIVESTINPGVMDEMVIPLLKQRRDLPLEVDHPHPGRPLYLAHCPERINPGDPHWSVRNIPRVIGGYSPRGTERARQFYESVIEAPLKSMASATEAEAVKILENTFRDINIAYINEMARSFAVLGIDIINVINGAATKPFAFLPHYPGNGVGGHCISVDPYYMIARGREVGFNHKFLKLARRINEAMPAYTVDLLATGLAQINSSGQVALLGLAYKKNVSDLRHSPALKTLKILRQKKYPVVTYDPYLPDLSNVPDLKAALKNTTAVMLACDHDQLVEQLTPALLKSAGVKLIVDAKNALAYQPILDEHIHYLGIGRIPASSQWVVV